jgi:NRPS condensation-like uncharacterized protein
MYNYHIYGEFTLEHIWMFKNEIYIDGVGKIQYTPAFSGARDVDAMMFVPITGHYAYKAGIGVIQYD